MRVEVVGALGRLGNADAITELTGLAVSDEHPEGMEAVLILSELAPETAADGLVEIATNRRLDEELRAAAVWGLGATRHNEPTRLLQFIGDPSDYVAVHAVVAAGSDLDPDVCEAAAQLVGGDTRQAAAATRLLANQGPVGARVLAEIARGATGSTGIWALRGLGLAGRGAVAAVDLPAETIRLLEPMLAAEDGFVDQEDVLLKLLLFVGKQVSLDPIV